MQMVGAIEKCRPCSPLDRVFEGRGELPLIFGKFAPNGAGGNGGWAASGRKNQEATDAHWNKQKILSIQAKQNSNNNKNGKTVVVMDEIKSETINI